MEVLFLQLPVSGIGGLYFYLYALYREYFSYTPTYKLFFCTNEVPHIRSQNYAIKRRIKVIPFRQRFYEPSDGKEPVRDNKLLEKLLSEKSGVLKWAVEGCLEWQKDGLNPPAVVLQEVNRLFESQDALGEFIDSECVLDPMAEAEVTELWARYLAWCESIGIKPAYRDVRWFSRSLVQRDGIDASRGTGGTRLLTGIALRKLDGTGNQFCQCESDISDIKTAFSEKYSDSSFTREFLQKPRNDATDATVKTVETGKKLVLTN